MTSHERLSAAVWCRSTQTCPVVSACHSPQETPCLKVARAHEGKLALCAEIEAIADALPRGPDHSACLRLADRLVPMLRQAHRYEEDVLFPAFEAGIANPAAETSIRRLKKEHVEDQCGAQDISEALMAIGHGAPIANPEAFGFMLRAFFETLRRHIAFEREHILPASLWPEAGRSLMPPPRRIH